MKRKAIRGKAWRNDPKTGVPAVLQVMPTKWDLFLMDAGLSKDEAREIAAGRLDGPLPRLKHWVARYRTWNFIPEDILLALGMPLLDAQVTLHSICIERNRARSMRARQTAE